MCTETGFKGVEINWSKNQLRWKTEELELNIYEVFSALHKAFDIVVNIDSIREENGYIVATFKRKKETDVYLRR